MIKKTLSMLVVTTLATQMAFAGFKVPKSVYRVSDLDQAKSEAAEKGKPLVFVYSNTKSN